MYLRAPVMRQSRVTAVRAKLCLKRYVLPQNGLVSTMRCFPNDKRARSACQLRLTTLSSASVSGSFRLQGTRARRHHSLENRATPRENSNFADESYISPGINLGVMFGLMVCRRPEDNHATTAAGYVAEFSTIRADRPLRDFGSRTRT
jgi:hypothetical protein